MVSKIGSSNVLLRKRYGYIVLKDVRVVMM